MERRCSIKHNRMLTNHLFKNVPDLGDLLLNQFLGSLDGGGHATQLKLVKNERLEEFKRHEFGKAALVKL